MALRLTAIAMLVALASGGMVWILHLLASYFLVSLGCARGWPALGWTLALGSGRVVADIAAGRVPAIDIEGFRFG